MSKHLRNDLDKLTKSLLSLGARVEESVRKSIRAFEDRRPELAEEVIQDDRLIDEQEVELEENCLKTLALHQPVAEDLRFISTILKINNDLERMGDLAANVAKRARSLAKGTPIRVPAEFQEITKTTLEMVRECLDAFIHKDAYAARKVCAKDDKVDDLNRTIVKEVRKRMSESSDEIDQSLDLFSTARRLERIADLATNIAQDVVYMVEGEIIRHKPDAVPRTDHGD